MLSYNKFFSTGQEAHRTTPRGLAFLPEGLEFQSFYLCGLKHLHCELDFPGQSRQCRMEPDRRRQPQGLRTILTEGDGYWTNSCRVSLL